MDRRATVQFALGADELAAMEYAGPRVAGPRAYSVMNAPIDPKGQPIPDGYPTLELELDVDDLDEARDAAERLYAEMRSEAQLPPAEPRIVGVFFVHGEWPRAEEFIDEVFDMLDQRRYEWAVVAAQAACEVEIRHLIEATLPDDAHPLAALAVKLPRSFSLMDPAGRGVFGAAFGRSPTEADCWQAYQEHVARRNNVVHRGSKVSEADARASLDAMHAMLEFVRSCARPST